MENKNLIIVRRQTLAAALETVRYKIKHLQNYYSREQVRCWFRERNKIVRELRYLPTDEQIQAGAKRVNFSNSSKIQKR